MAQRSFTWSNKLGAGYPAKPVWLTGGGGGLENFAADRQQLDRADRRGGSIWARVAAAPRAAGWRKSRPAARTDFQRFFAGRLGQVARVKSHGGRKGAVSCGAAVPSRFIASYRTGCRLSADLPALARPDRSGPGGVSPLSIAAARPYPGRAGQTQDPGKSAQGRPSPAGCACARVRKGRETLTRAMGSGVRSHCGRAKSGVGDAGGAGIGLGGCGAHFRLDLGKAAKLGGGRG